MIDPGLRGVRCEGFEIVAEEGFGRSTRVFQARELASGETVALKIFDGRANPDETRMAVRREAQVAGVVGNGGEGGTFALVLARRGEVAEIDGHPYPALVSRWFEGEPLGQWLIRGHDDEARVRVVGALLEAVEALHGVGFAHNDLGFGNVLIGARVALIDFGRATPVDEADALLRGLIANPFYDGGSEVADGGLAHDLRAFAVLGLLVLARHHPFCAQPAELFSGAIDPALLFRSAPDLGAIHPNAPGGPALADWLGPALRLAPGETATGLRRRSPFKRLDHG